MQDANDARRKRTCETLRNNSFVGLSGGFEENIQQGTILEKEMAKSIGDCKDNMAMWNVEHALSEGVGTLHIVEIPTGKTEAGFAGKRNPADLIATIAGVHGTVFGIFTVEYFYDFRDNDRTQRLLLQHREPITKDLEEEGNAF